MSQPYNPQKQKVNGPVGGLSIILDAQTEHYLPATVRDYITKLLVSLAQKAVLTNFNVYFC